VLNTALKRFFGGAVRTLPRLWAAAVGGVTALPKMRAALLSLLLPVASCAAGQASIPSRPNVLVIAVDDLRPALGCYGDRFAKTPNIDRLAARGVVFARAYSQQSVCSASRTSMLTGLRPDTTGIYDNATHFRSRMPDAVTLPEQFRRHGYETLSIGKIFHSQWDRAYVGRQLDDSRSWSEPAWYPAAVQFYFSPEGQRIAREVYARTAPCPLDGRALCLHSNVRSAREGADTDPMDPKYDAWKQHFVMGPVTEAPEVADNLLYDGQVADRAIATLKRVKDRNFFLAVGFTRPHVPYVAPKKYWELFASEDLPSAPYSQRPDGSPAWALPPMQDFNGYADVPSTGRLPDALLRRLTHGYYASVAFVDAQIGRIIAELERLQLAENTIIVFWGDHGFHVGENSRWGKQTCFEAANRQPLIVCAPKQPGNGRVSRALVESVDVYPSLCELAGLPMPASLEGASVVPLLREPIREWKTAAFSQFPRPVRPGGGKGAAQADDKMGYSMRTDRYRYVEWRYVLRAEEIAGRELYDHEIDAAENRNIADEPAHRELVAQLHEQLNAGWRAARPK
jgi:iduronate 2-sulfatase